MFKDRKSRLLVLYSTLCIIGLFFFFHILISAKTFLVPLAIALLLSMLVAPVATKLENNRVGRGMSAFLADLILIALTVVLFIIVGMQVKAIKDDWPKLKEQLLSQSESFDRKIQRYPWLEGQVPSLNKHLERIITSGEHSAGEIINPNTQGSKQSGNPGSSQEKIHGNNEEKVQNSSNSPHGGGSGFAGNMLSKSWKILTSFLGFFGTMLLVFVYVFFFTAYRKKFKLSALRFFPEDKRNETEEVIEKASRVAQNYLIGRLILIGCLAVMYSIGLMVSGVKYAIFISILAAVFSLVPYIGNIIGAGFALFMAMLSGGGGGNVAGVVITFSVAQFVESYVLEPFIVGHKVSLNPVVTIVAVIFGEFVWGIPGMVVAIPLLGIVKVLCDHVDVLSPLGFALGEEGTRESDNVFNKFEKWISNKFEKQH